MNVKNLWTMGDVTVKHCKVGEGGGGAELKILLCLEANK